LPRRKKGPQGKRGGQCLRRPTSENERQRENQIPDKDPRKFRWPQARPTPCRTYGFEDLLKAVPKETKAPGGALPGVFFERQDYQSTKPKRKTQKKKKKKKPRSKTPNRDARKKKTLGGAVKKNPRVSPGALGAPPGRGEKKRKKKGKEEDYCGARRLAFSAPFPRRNWGVPEGCQETCQKKTRPLLGVWTGLWRGSGKLGGGRWGEFLRTSSSGPPSGRPAVKNERGGVRGGGI